MDSHRNTPAKGLRFIAKSTEQDRTSPTNSHHNPSPTKERGRPKKSRPPPAHHNVRGSCPEDTTAPTPAQPNAQAENNLPLKRGDACPSCNILIHSNHDNFIQGQLIPPPFSPYSPNLATITAKPEKELDNLQANPPPIFPVFNYISPPAPPQQSPSTENPSVSPSAQPQIAVNGLQGNPPHQRPRGRPRKERRQPASPAFSHESEAKTLPVKLPVASPKKEANEVEARRVAIPGLNTGDFENNNAPARLPALSLLRPCGNMKFIAGSVEWLRKSICSDLNMVTRSPEPSAFWGFIKKHSWGTETVGGARAEHGAVKLVLFNVPSGMQVNGVDDGGAVPAWNAVNQTLILNGMAVASAVMSDDGYLACVHVLDQCGAVETAASDAGFRRWRRFGLTCNKPVYRDETKRPPETVDLLVISVFCRRGLPPPALEPKSCYLQGGVLGDGGCSLDRSAIRENVDKEKWVRKADGKPWRGGAERDDSVWEFLVSSLSRPGNTVLDLIAGTGGFVRVASALGRHALGVEKDEDIMKGLLNPQPCRIA